VTGWFVSNKGALRRDTCVRYSHRLKDLERASSEAHFGVPGLVLAFIMLGCSDSGTEWDRQTVEGLGKVGR
jgi:hypothetical protein